jgi:hypothetical protein
LPQTLADNTLVGELRRRKLYPLNGRQQRIDDMLTRFLEVRDTTYRGGIGSGEGGGPRMTDVWRHGGFAVLERQLDALRHAGHLEPVVNGGVTRTLYWHVAEWYLRRPRIPVCAATTIVRYRKAGILHEEEKRPRGNAVAWRFGATEADPAQVREGLVWLDEAWPAWELQPRSVAETLAEMAKRRARVAA